MGCLWGCSSACLIPASLTILGDVFILSFLLCCLEEPSQPILTTGTAFPVFPSHTLKGDVHSLAKTDTNMSLSPVPLPFLAVLEAGTALQGNV